MEFKTIKENIGEIKENRYFIQDESMILGFIFAEGIIVGEFKILRNLHVVGHDKYW